MRKGDTVEKRDYPEPAGSYQEILERNMGALLPLLLACFAFLAAGWDSAVYIGYIDVTPINYLGPVADPVFEASIGLALVRSAYREYTQDTE